MWNEQLRPAGRLLQVRRGPAQGRREKPPAARQPEPEPGPRPGARPEPQPQLQPEPEPEPEPQQQPPPLRLSLAAFRSGGFSCVVSVQN